MLSPRQEGRNMSGDPVSGSGAVPRDPISGAMLIAGALAGVVVLALHPTGHSLAQDFESQARIGRMVHALAIASVPMVFQGLLGLKRRLGPSSLATSGLIAYGWAGVAVLTAAVMSGFVSTALIGDMRQAADDAAKSLAHALADYSFLVNQGFAKVYLVSSSLSILLFSAAMLATRRMTGALGGAGVMIAALILVLFGVGHLQLDVHGFGIMTIAQSTWFIAAGALLWRGDAAAATPASGALRSGA
jgi:hypothetical protein